MRDGLQSGGAGRTGTRGVILCDFDGTITTVDVTDTLCRQSIPERWAELERQWLSGEISATECYEREYEALGLGQEQIDAFLETVALSPGTQRLIRLADELGWEFHVLSAGFDYYIERILHQRGLPVPYTANSLSFTPEGKPVLRFLDGTDPQCRRFRPPCAGCKPATWREWKQRGYRIAFVGDGTTDFCMADAFKLAREPGDLLFAKKRLLQYCHLNDIPAIPYETLDDVAERLARSRHRRP
ncbi:MAG: HAD-IB family phosphatase [Anaerolineae bacterium]|nr:HAD-IB family phosphatase [Anaerolineae bacterium]